VGAHWPLDILLGAVFGFVGGISGAYLVLHYKKWWGWLENDKSSGKLFFAIILLLLSIYLRDLITPTDDGLLIIYSAMVMGTMVSCYLILNNFYQQIKK